MSQSYQSLLFPGLDRDAAAGAQARVTAALQDADVIGHDAAADRVHGGEGYFATFAPTARFTDLREDPEHWAGFAAPAAVAQDMPALNGVGVRVGFGINGLEFNTLEDMTCPVCLAEAQGRTAADLAGEAATLYHQSGTIPEIECPSCGAATDARDWVSSNVPGFAYLAYEFWNWPDLRMGGWTLDIPALMRAAADSPIRYSGAML